MMIVAFVPAVLAAVVSMYFAEDADSTAQRILAWVPVVPVAIDGAAIFIGTAFDPTSHNLWPLELLFASAISLFLFGILWAARSGPARR